MYMYQKNYKSWLAIDKIIGCRFSEHTVN